MGAELVEEPQPTRGVAKRHQVLAEKLHSNRWTVGLRQLAR
jgi:hypothetical protein